MGNGRRDRRRERQRRRPGQKGRYPGGADDGFAVDGGPERGKGTGVRDGRRRGRHGFRGQKISGAGDAGFRRGLAEGDEGGAGKAL